MLRQCGIIPVCTRFVKRCGQENRSFSMHSFELPAASKVQASGLREVEL